MEQSPNGGNRARGKKSLIIMVIVAVLVIAGIVAAVWFGMQRSGQGGGGSAAEKQLYGALGNAARQQKLRVGMYRETFATKDDADARQNVGTFASSVSEVDTKAGKYRSVFAHNLLEEDGSFSIGRCIDGTTYSEAYQSPATNTTRAKTLQEAAGQLGLVPSGNLYQVTQPLTFIACPHLGLLPANPPIAVARLSDGVFPVTLSDQQAQKWQTKLEAAKLFDVKDEGMVEKDGKTLRKISFTSKDDDLTVNQKLYDMFHEAGEIKKIKSEQPKAEVDYEFQSINPNKTGGVGGYYLIDEAKNLPIYSELYGTNEDKEAGKSRAAGLNIARTKQTYAYPDQLTIELATPLEFLN
jgi:hypothetical protein